KALSYVRYFLHSPDYVQFAGIKPGSKSRVIDIRNFAREN
ncbi:hypothetical protein HMPREF1098_04213, partial [[Clostridium] clostridioforme CM201]